MPTITRGRLTSPYGYQAWRGYVHSGCDLAGITPGTKPDILAAKRGVVELVGTNRVPLRRGTHVVIRHDDGTRSFYGHVSGVRVKEGQQVTRRQPIATMDHTGLSASAGIHLHFEVWRNASHTSHVNPVGWLRLNGWRFTDGRLEDRGDPNATTTTSTTTTAGGLTVSDINKILAKLDAIDDRVKAHDANSAQRRRQTRDQLTGVDNRVKAHDANGWTQRRSTAAQIAALQEALDQLSKAEGVELDYDKIEAAAQRGAENALAEGIEVEVVANASVKEG